MQRLNSSELMREMIRHRCFHATNAESRKCMELLNLISRNDSLNVANNELQRGLSDDYRVMNGVVLAVYSIAIFLNCTLLWLMYKNPLKRFRSPTGLLMANLAVSDLLGAVFSLVIEAEVYKEHTNSEATTVFLPWMVAITVQCSYYTVILISLERYLAIAYPIRYRIVVLMKHVVTAVVACWLLSFAISTPLFFGQNRDKIEVIRTGIYAAYTFILIVVILVLYPLTHFSLRRQRKQLLTMNGSNTHLRRTKLRMEKHFANSMFLVYFSLVVFTSPYVVVFFFISTGCDSCVLNNYFLHIWMYFRLFFALHFGVNPVIYAFRLPSYKDSFMYLISWKRRSDLGRNARGTVTLQVGKQNSDRRDQSATVSAETQT